MTPDATPAVYHAPAPNRGAHHRSLCGGPESRDALFMVTQSPVLVTCEACKRLLNLPSMPSRAYFVDPRTLR